jgi:hypothetical protein
MEQIMSTAMGFVGGVVGGVVAWFATNYWGRALLRFWDLRLEAHEAMFFYANINADRPVTPANLARAGEGSLRFRTLGAKIDGLRTVLPAPLSWYLHKRSYDLRQGALGLIGLSNWLGADDHKATRSRVQAQRALRLPVDLQEQEQVDREQRLKNASDL